MSFIDEVYKPVDPYIEEKNFVHNLFFVGAVKNSVVKNKTTRRLEGYYHTYTEEYGDTFSDIHPTEYNWFPDKYYYKDLNWNYIEALLKEEMKDIGFKSYEVKVMESTYQDKVEDGFTVFLGRKKYRYESVRYHYIWIRAFW